MKNEFLTILAVVVAMIGMSNDATADLVSYSEKYQGSNILLDAKSSNFLTLTLDITDNEGWSLPDQVFSDGILKIVLEDDKGRRDGKELAVIEYENKLGRKTTLQKKAKRHEDINSSYWRNGFSVDYAGFADGIVTATIRAKKGDFFIRSAELTVDSNYPPNNAPVPEPATMFLFGTGLAGLAFVSHRKKL